MNSSLQIVENTHIFREYTRIYQDEYETRAHNNDPQYTYNSMPEELVSMFFIYKEDIPDPFKLNGSIHGYWRWYRKTKLHRLVFFRLHKNTSICSCDKGMCKHKKCLNSVHSLMKKLGLHEKHIAFNVMKFLF